MIVADRSADQMLGRDRVYVEATGASFTKSNVGGAINDYRVNGY